MKYIRTKDGVYEVEKPSEDNDFLVENDVYVLTTVGYLPYKKDIIAQADTIEELCDEFVWDKDIIRFGPDKKHFSYANDDFLFELDNYIIKEGVYGAIWTDKGLIYVAKLNEKGVLELI